ncbi:hypothetical protein GobsT_30590 [Gemmata obscuriglobus]|uniref:Lipoprotein n=1 Tax=Gemmata obscuriglobus TaxID=114 RepID=A0A2Z3H6T7_9BACT|nr:hypothetical protein [Gemmata obscuriglobus]AWM38745.1 hypothetical protein C1280_18295 [Gemmata obscuriglobus]QEG28283.1 hypothetical protein GobsT_30590 [Gemmata obscuriglobus]VTS06101.1 Uncharacterized protein OS=Singulisphaera acidiphila (strain ATCC BAA-1392 / DSM 18658 / VKM B-2454 / MOB10) GN=Sinac_1997 PE=4 SV=1 [Gemmata obscuriglobus UQM 2246]
MRLTYLATAALVAFAFGCNKSPEGGTPNTNASFKLSLPTAKDVKQGNTESYDASVERGSDFKKDVKLSVEGKPEKLTVKLSKDAIKAGDGDTKFTITVTPDKDAPIGKHDVKIVGTPDGGGTPTSQTFSVTVTENK